ncbi:MAG: S9 family peptidase [Dysgonamonadaceae bacterium]|jgi:dipeptidyl-peptidase-4|nr:S9 family peptidase [Dysgonamonadaceae bacterium]
MMKRFIYIFAFIGMAIQVSAQEKTFTLEDLIPGGKSYTSFNPKTTYRVQWYGDDLIFLEKEEIFLVNPKKPDEKKSLLTKAELNALLAQTNLEISQLSFTTINDAALAVLRIPKENKQVFLDLKHKTLAFETTFRQEWENADFCPKNRETAYTKKNNLYIDREGQTITVAEDTDDAIVYGQSVHRNEFGITKGTFWSPEGNYLAFYRMDESMVGNYPLVDISAREAQLKNNKYPMAGMTSHEVTLGIYKLSSKTTVYLKTGEPRDHYLTNISWDPNEKFVYIAELNRGQNQLQLNKYDVETGEKTLTLFEEHNDKYVEPQHPLQFLKNSPDRFIWQSQRSGYNHLYLYDTSGKLILQLTNGNYDVTNSIGLDIAEKNVFILTNELNPIEFQAYKVALKTGNKTQLTFEAGVHQPSINVSGKYMIDRYSNLNTPLNIDLISTEKPKPVRLQTAQNPYLGYAMPTISLGAIKAADGETELFYHLVKPVNFDSSKKYPVVIYVYGGPHSQGIRNSWLGAVRGWDIYMAQKGYVVFSLDNRGTSNRGADFENITYRQLGIVETADQMEGVKYLQSLPYVDADRIGVHGWSYGGFMTANLMLRHPETFKTGVAGGPVMDWKYYEIMYGERYMDTPEENSEGYAQTNMNNLAGNLKGHFLLIHGDEDPTVVWQNSLSFLKACIKARTYPDYFVYPGHGHNMSGPDRVHLHEKITRYFEDYLK